MAFAVNEVLDAIAREPCLDRARLFGASQRLQSFEVGDHES
jgi:hypothetical protein